MVAKKESGTRPGKKVYVSREPDIIRFDHTSTKRIDRLFSLIKLSLFLSFSTLSIIIALILYQNWEKLPQFWMLLGI
jgi:hypothetical protein